MFYTARDWFAAVVIYKLKSPLMQTEVLIQEECVVNPEFPNQRPKIKFPGGKSRGKPDKDPFLTAQRELLEETYLEIDEDDSILFLEEVDKGPNHFQQFFAVPFEACRGELRTEVIYGENSRLEPPDWCTLDVAKTIIYPSHQIAILKLIERLRAKQYSTAA